MEREATTILRRDFLRGGRKSAVAAIRPPGLDETALLTCTGCGACAAHCPTHIISLVDHLPMLDFSVGACTFCGACAQNCPERIFAGAPATSLSHTIAIAASCLPLQGVDCQACRDVCPTGAIRFQPVRGGPFVPDVTVAACTGCGACIAVCPVGAAATAPKSVEAVHA